MWNLSPFNLWASLAALSSQLPWFFFSFLLVQRNWELFSGTWLLVWFMKVPWVWEIFTGSPGLTLCAWMALFCGAGMNLDGHHSWFGLWLSQPSHSSEWLSCAEAEERRASVEMWCSPVNTCHLHSLTQSAGLLPAMLICFSLDHKLYPKIKPGSLI